MSSFGTRQGRIASGKALPGDKLSVQTCKTWFQCRLCKQIVIFKSLANRNKSHYYRNIVNENTLNSKNFFAGLALHSVPETFLPSHDFQKNLSNHFRTFFKNKFTKIRKSFSSTESFTFPVPQAYLNLTFLYLSLKMKYKRQ